MHQSSTTSSPFLRAGTAIDGIEVRQLAANRDDRGTFTEVFCAEWGLPIEPSQWSVVSSAARVLRGVYLHLRHDEYISVLAGRASIGLRDLRLGSPTEGAWSLYEIDEEAPVCICFPAGIAHGWYFHTGSLHLQAVSESYVDYGHDDNLGCHWADPALQIPWPDRSPIVSDRSNALGPMESLREQIARILAAGPR